MVQKPLRYPNADCAEMAVRLHKFESTKVSGPGSSRRKITDVLWTKKEAEESLSLLDKEKSIFERLLKSLEKQNHLMRIPGYLDGQDGFITRTAETLRIIGHTYEYWPRGRPGVDAIRWEIVPKEIPRRDIKPIDFIERLINEISEKSGKDESSTSLGFAITEVINGIVKHFQKVDDISQPRFSEFQYRATVQGLFDALGYGEKGSILVAGVGSGKTLAFMLPPLILAKRDIKEGTRPYGAHLFLYPRKALALDQFSKSLKPYAKAVGIPIKQVHSEMGKHYKTLQTKSVYKGIQAVHNGNNQPRLIISSLETLKNRIAHPTIVGKLFSRLETVTMDEVHLQSGVQGAQAAMLMRRMGQLCPTKTTWVGASATIAKPEDHLGRLMGIDSNRIKLIDPEPEEMQIDGVVHHAFMRPSGLISQAGVLTNATSLMVHHRRDDLSKRPGPKQSQKAPKVITFADNLELLGAWNDDLRENERTDVYDTGHGQIRYHPNTENMGNEDDWSSIQRELPYARRFQDTLERRIEAYGGQIPEANGGGTALAPVFEEWRGKDVCKRCKNGERFELGHADLNTMYELGKLVHRAPHKPTDPFLPFYIDNEVFLLDGVVGTMDMCPYLQAAACTSFSSHPVEEVRKIGDSSSGIVKYDFASRATSRIQSSKSEDYSEEADDLSLAIFRAPNDVLHSVEGARGEDFVDVVMASPSLEVGVDLPNLTESVMTRAVRNLASYRQKAGRVGRESMSEALNLTLATDSANDLHYYRQPLKLIHRGRLEPVPLKEKNEAVARSTAYLSIWDILVQNGKIPEALLEGNPITASNMVESSFQFIDDKRNRILIHQHISNVLDDERFPVDTDWFDDAILQVKDELSLLLKPLSGYRFDPPLPEPRTVIAAIRHLRGSGRQKNAAVPVDNANELIDEFESAQKESEKRKSNLGFLRLDDPELLDQIIELLRTSLPNIDEIENIIDEISSKEKNDYADSPAKKKKIRGFRRSFEDFSEAAEKLQDSGIDMLSFRAIEQYQNLAKIGNEAGWKSYYLSATIRTLEVFKYVRRDAWFVSPDALYIHPHMKQVRLTDPEAADRSARWKHLNLREDQALIPLSEALHSFLPGMWTRRLPQTTFKVLARETEATGQYTLRAILDDMEAQGLKYEIIGKSLPAPPGLIGDIQVISPIEIPIRPLINKRTIRTSIIGPEVLDGDEGNPQGQETNRPRIPKSFSQSWLHVKLENGELIEPYIDLGEDERLIETTPIEGDAHDVDPNRIIHPLAESAFSSVQWHDDTIVTEYVYGLNRTLPSNEYDGSEVFYSNQRGAYTSFGQKINTEGIAFTLNLESIETIKQQATESMIEGKSEWIPSMIRAFRSYLRAMGGQRPLSNFVLDDIIAILIAYWRISDCPNLSLSTLQNLSQELVNHSELLSQLVESRVDAKMRIRSDVTQLPEDDEEVRNNRVNRMMGEVRGALNQYLEDPNSFQDYISLWFHRTILMSFGVSAVSATQRVAGGDNKEIGFGLTDDSWDGKSTTVVLYDRAECGNGNVSVARTFMHIPNIVRSARGRRGGFLPTMDFLSTLEEILLPCAQQHCDILGLEYFRTKGVDSVLHRSMVDYTESGKEIHYVGESVWSSLNLEGPTDGWKLPLFHYMRRELAEDIGQEQDDVTRATRICWNGCPECIERIDIVQGGFAGMDFLDKSVMDYWFRHLRNESNEYIDIEPDSLTDGSSGIQLGDLHTIALEPEDTGRQRIRSLMLPWTIGVDLNRSNLDEGIRLIIRQSDLVGHRQSEPNEGIAMGMPSSAFKRLLWFDLLMTAYLDMRGALSNSQKKIKLVYYDARDISFEDVGLAPQLLEALRAQAKNDQAGPLETFSDMLIWLARRGFEIKMCVDKRVRNNPQNGPVRDFINKLRSPRAVGRIELFERGVIDDNEWTSSMHKKTMVTPIFVLKGTSNMTRSGAGRNEEDVDHVMFGTPQYESMNSSCNDTLSRATRIN